MPGWLLIVLLAPLPVRAETPYARMPQTANTPVMVNPPIQQTAMMSGIIVSIDSIFQHITVRAETGDEEEFSLTANTPVSGYSAPGKFHDLQVGDRVQVTYSLQPQHVKNVLKQ